MNILNNKINYYKLSNVFLLLLAVMLPFLFLLITVCVLSNNSLWSYIPKGGDGLGYWAQISAFVKASFNSGYFCWGELIAPVSYFHFSVHGPGFTIVYGLLGKVFGWHWYSPPLFNVGFLMASLALLAIMINNRSKYVGVKLLFLAIIVLTTWSDLIYLFNPLQEAFHVAIAIILGGLLVNYLHSKQNTYWLFLLLISISLASIIRPTWSLLFFPIALIESSQMKLNMRITLLCLGMVAPLLFFSLWRMVSAPLPYGYGPLDWVSSYIDRRLHGELPSRLIVDQFSIFTKRLFDVERLKNQLIYFVFVWQTILYFIFCAVFCSLDLKKRHIISKLDIVVIWLLFINLLNAIYIYQVEPDAQARLLAAPLLIAVVLHIFAGKKCHLWLASSLLLSNLFLISWGIDSLSSSVSDGWSAKQVDAYVQLRNELSTLIQYDASKPAWCNTVLISNYDNRVVSYPPGIGLAWTPHTQWIGHPPHARYALVDEEVFKQLSTLGRYELVSKTSLGNLYKNLTAGCE